MREEGRKRRLITRLIAWVLCIGMLTGVFQGIPGLEFETKMQVEAAGETNFVQKIDTPKSWEKYYFSDGNPLYRAGYGMPNCTAYAWGRAWEILGTFPKLSVASAKYWYGYTQDGYARGSTPQLGAIACWGGEFGHVAVVEEIHADGKITISESSYPNKYYPNGIMFRRREIPGNGYDPDSGTFQGYIYIRSGSGNQPVPTPTVTNATHHNSLTETSAVLSATIMNPTAASITKHGITIFGADKESRVGSTEQELTGNLYQYQQYKNLPIWYDTKTELNITLYPGRTYYYQFWARIGGNTYYSEKQPFKTLGDETPNPPELSVDKTAAAVGDMITVSWKKDMAAINGYDITLTAEDGSYTKTVNANNADTVQAMFTLPTAGTYKVTGIAKGGKNSGVGTLNKKITAYNPSTVTFVQELEDGTIETLKTESVKYGHGATAPSAPSREGYTFQGWDKNYNNITSDTTVKARFTKNQYTITFVGENGAILKEEKVYYKESATPPTGLQSENEGYVFAGWSSNAYENVKENATITASFVWENEDLPIIVKLNSCKYEEEGYTVSYDLNNYNVKKTQGRAIVCLKTSTGKLLVTTESNAFTLAKGEKKTGNEIFVPYEGVATTAEIIIVNSFSDEIPISKSAKVGISRDWSAWSTQKPEGNYEIESRTEYRYRDKEFTTSNQSTLSGWTKSNTTWAWGNYGNWSGWSRTAYTASDSRQVESRSVQDTAAYTNYKYYYWRNGNGTSYGFNQFAGWTYKEYITTTPFNYLKTVYDVAGYRYPGGYIYYSNELWYLASTWVTPATYHTEWRYRDRSKVYTYTYWRWKNWSNWSTTSATATSNKEVQTRTVYRYKAKMTDVEDNSGTSRTISGKVSAGSAMAGKQAVLFIYKGLEPADYNNEYVGQVTLAADGSYSFTLKTREEPSQVTGDFTIDLAIEGASEPIYLDTIKAPVPVYEVTFIDEDGTVLETRQVEKGETALLPENPTKEHYRFVGWDRSNTNIQEDTVIKAVYEKESYSVLWVEWESQQIKTETYNYGDNLVIPVENGLEGYTFVHWKDENGAAVTNETIVNGNMILSAVYEASQYTVNFYDWQENLISTQQVTHGQAAQTPEIPEREGLIFMGWSNVDYQAVTQDMDIYPYYQCEETAEKPVISVNSGSFEKAFQVELTAEAGAEIYYTLDGSTPDTYANKYQGAINIDKNAILQVVAYVPGKNESAVAKAVYLISDTEDTDGALKIKKANWDVERGEETEITYFLSHENEQIGVEFFTLEEEVASVTDNGTIIGNNEGETLVFAYTEDLKYADYCTVAVTDSEIHVESIQLNENFVCLDKGESTQLVADVYPQNATNTDIVWISSDYEVADVNDDGTVQIGAYGSACISAYSYNGGYVAQCTIVATEPILYLSDDSVSLKKGETYQVTVQKYGTFTEEFSWESKNNAIAQVDENGTITAVSEGITEICYKSANGTYKETVMVSVSEGAYDIKEAVIEPIPEQTYSGKEITPEVVVTWNGKTLIKDTDYELLYTDNKEAGTGKVYVIGKGSYSGILTGTFIIKGTQNGEVPNGGNTSTGDSNNESADNGNETQAYTITYQLNGGKNHVSNPTTYKNQSVTLKNPTRKGYVFKGWYQDKALKKQITSIPASAKTNYTLYAKWSKVSVKKASLKSVKSNKAGKIKVTCGKVSGAEGYEITYSYNRKFTKKTTKKIFTSKTTYTIKKLKKGKVYYVKVRAYKLDSTGKKVYGKASGVKKVRVKK